MDNLTFTTIHFLLNVILLIFFYIILLFVSHSLPKRPLLSLSLSLSLSRNSITIGHPLYDMKRKAFLAMWDKLVVLYHHWSSLIWHEEEGFPSNVGLSKPKMTTSATLGLGKNSPHIKNHNLFLR